MLENEINILKGKIVGFSYHVENMIDETIKGFQERDKEILRRVIKKDERKANRIDIDIEKHCITAMAQFAPMASDLRTLLMILKMNKDIERMADHCVNICYNLKDIMDSCYVIIDSEKIVYEMAEKVRSMLKESIKSFIEEDADRAKDVLKKDESVNTDRMNITNFFIDKMKEDKNVVECALFYIDIAQNLERIADLSTNIAEDTVFVLKGKMIKHRNQ